MFEVILTQVVSCSSVRCGFSHSRGFVSFQVCTSQFLLYPLVLMTSVDDGSDLSNSISFRVFEFRFSRWFRSRCRRNRRTVQRASRMCWDHSCGDSQISKITLEPSVTPLVSSLLGLLMSNRWSIPSLVPKLQEIFPDKGARGNFVVPALDVRAQVSAFMIAEMELENRSFVLLFVDTNRNSM